MSGSVKYGRQERPRTEAEELSLKIEVVEYAIHGRNVALKGLHGQYVIPKDYPTSRKGVLAQERHDLRIERNALRQQLRAIEQGGAMATAHAVGAAVSVESGVVVEMPSRVTMDAITGQQANLDAMGPSIEIALPDAPTQPAAERNAGDL